MEIIKDNKVVESLNFQNASEEEINNALNNDVFVFVLVHWCPYCIKFKNQLIEFINDIKNKRKKNVVILDGDKIKENKYPALSGYSGFPGLLYLVNGEIKEKYVSERTPENLKNLFKKWGIIDDNVCGKKKSKKKKRKLKTKRRKKVKKNKKTKKWFLGLF